MSNIKRSVGDISECGGVSVTAGSAPISRFVASYDYIFNINHVIIQSVYDRARNREDNQITAWKLKKTLRKNMDGTKKRTTTTSRQSLTSNTMRSVLFCFVL